MTGDERTKRVVEISDAADDYVSLEDRMKFITNACGVDEELRLAVLDYFEGGEKLFLEPIARKAFDVGTPGSSVGPYQILEQIGEGGMGKVYKASDPRLNRVVAVKVSKTAFSDRVAVEARAVASLNHRNICTVYDVGPDYLVMEYIDGAPIKGPLPLDQTLRYAIQICDALGAAHRKGIIHQDLKPDNILVTKTEVKLLDFGLARTGHGGETSSDERKLADDDRKLTGTFRYMSPEQFPKEHADRVIDARTDIFSFGLVLYEMLTGRQVFAGTERGEVFASILKSPAPSIAGFAPPALDRAFRRCLEKNPDDRWQTVHDLKAELEWIRDNPPKAHHRIIAFAPWIVAAVCLAACLFFAFGSRNPPRQAATRTTIPLPSSAFVSPGLSRDGTRLLYSQAGIPPRLWLKMMDQLEGHPIPGTEQGESGTLSPDGQWIAFLKGPRPYKLAKIPATGGRADILSSEADFITAPFWTEDGFILAGSGRGLMRVPAAGGLIEDLTKVDRAKGEIGHFEPVPLPGGRGILFTVSTGSSFDSARDSAKIAVLDLRSHRYQVLQTAGSGPKYVSTGHLTYLRNGTLFAVSFDAAQLRVTGAEAPVLDSLATGLLTGAAPYTFSPAGLLIYRLENDSSESTTLAWMDRKGIAQTLPEPHHPWRTVPLAPDGQRAAGDLPDREGRGGKERIWIYDLARGILTPLSSGGRDFAPVWHPDGRSLAFGSNRDGKFGIYRVPADSISQPELLFAAESISYPSSWGPDGRTLLYSEFAQSKGVTFLLPIDVDGKAGQPFRFHPEETSSEVQPVVSPDGKWLAYSSDHSGRFEVYVSPLQGSGGRYQISTQGGRLPKWSRNGRELFYVELNPRRLMAAEISPGKVFQVGAPKPLFVIRNDGGAVYYDVAPDGMRFLALTQPQGASGASFVMVTDWFEELARRTQLKK